MPRAKGGSIPPPRALIPPGYGGVISTLNENDVLSGRGGRINNHPGNITFRTVVEDYKREYLDPRTRKLEKAHVAARLVAQIRCNNPPGRFLKEDPDNPGKYIEIGDQKAWKKAGQALREDAPEVRKEIDEEMESEKQYHPETAYSSALPIGVPPSVSYSPSSAPVPLAPTSGPRPDPPPAVGITGYRQRPLPYFEGGRGPGAMHHYPRAPPPPHYPRHHQYPPPPPMQGADPPVALNQVMTGHKPSHPHAAAHYPGYPPPNYYGHPPPPLTPPHPHQHPHQHPPQSYPHQFPPHAPQSYPHPYSPHAQGNGTTPARPPSQPLTPVISNERPTLQAHRGKQPLKPKESGHSGASHPSPSPLPSALHGPVNAVASGVNQTLGAVSELTQRVKQRSLGSKTENKSEQKRKNAGSAEPDEDGQQPSRRQVAFNQDFPPTMSTQTTTTVSDLSSFGMSSAEHSNSFMNIHQCQDGVGQRNESIGTFSLKPSIIDKDKSSSENTRSSSSKSTGSELTMSGLGFSFGTSGRTNSFPDLLLSTGDSPLPTLPAGESDKEHSDNGNEAKKSKSKLSRLLRPMNHRSSSSESSSAGSSMCSVKIERSFHPVRGVNMRTLSGAMSIASIDSSRRSSRSDSSWLEPYKSMQSVNSDQIPWNDDGSMRSLLTDISNELNALDLAEPLLPPYQTDSTHDDSGSILRPDP